MMSQIHTAATGCTCAPFVLRGNAGQGKFLNVTVDFGEQYKLHSVCTF